MRISLRSLGLIGLLGGVGGAINAWLCYLKIPQPIKYFSPGIDTGVFSTSSSYVPHDFAWYVIPAGALHGALLALIPFLAARLWRDVPVLMRCGAAALVGWFTGCASWLPLNLSLGFSQPFYSFDLQLIWWPYAHFGLVALLLFLGLVMFRQKHIYGTFPFALGIGVASGVVGSLWWWIAWKPWYFSLLHGTIWGSLVGFGVWKAQEADQAIDKVHH